MRFLLGAVALLGCVAATPGWEPIPPELVPAVATAEQDGQALFHAMRAGTAPTPDQEREAWAQVAGPCDLAYKPIQSATSSGMAIYFIAQTREAGELIFGRHYRVQEGSVIASTNTCLIFPPGLPNAVASIVTHHLSPAPTEFHVFLSLNSGKIVIVATSAGNWIVDKGKISFLNKR